MTIKMAEGKYRLIQFSNPVTQKKNYGKTPSRDNIDKNQSENYITPKIITENMELMMLQLEDYHRFAVLNKMKFMVYLLEMTYMEAISIKKHSSEINTQKK